MTNKKIEGNNSNNKEMYEFKVFESENRTEENVDFKKEAKKICVFIDDYFSGGTVSEIKEIYRKKLKPVETMFVATLKTDKKCEWCNNDIKIGEIAYFENKSNKYFKIMHSDCAKKCWIQRLKENIMANAPQIIINDYCNKIGDLNAKILKVVTKNKQDIDIYVK